LSDLQDLAEIAYFWTYKEGNGDPKERAPMSYFTSEHADQYDIASAHLVRAILEIGGANV